MPGLTSEVRTLCTILLSSSDGSSRKQNKAGSQTACGTNTTYQSVVKERGCVNEMQQLTSVEQLFNCQTSSRHRGLRAHRGHCVLLRRAPGPSAAYVDQPLHLALAISSSRGREAEGGQGLSRDSNVAETK